MTNEMLRNTWEMVAGTFNRGCATEFSRQLNHCKAYMYGINIDGKNYVVLKSYQTVVAIWDIEENIIIDALRAVYGYTATSAQHISKFVKMWTTRCCKPCVYRFITWNDVKRIQ